MTRRTRGFTLIELMVVVAITGIIAALAMTSFSKNRPTNDVDQWVSLNRDAILVASRRAMSTQQPYMVQFTATTVQWCLVATTGAPTYASPQTTCTGLPTTVEQGPLNIAGGRDVESSFYAAASDVIGADGTTYTATIKNVMSGSSVLYFGRTGAASTQLVNVMTSAIPMPNTLGYTLYIRRVTNDDLPLRRRIVVYGLASKVRVVDNY